MPVTLPTLPARKTLRPVQAAQQLPPLKSPRVLGQLRERLRFLHYSPRTEEVYVYWVKAFIRFHGFRHPAELGGTEVEAFLTHLADDRSVAPSTHRQALSARLFFYGKVLGQQLPWLQEIGHPRRQRRLPVVLTVDEVRQVLRMMAVVAMPHALDRRHPRMGCELAMVLGVPPGSPFNRSCGWRGSTTSPVRPDLPADFQACGPQPAGCAGPGGLRMARERQCQSIASPWGVVTSAR